MLCKVDLSWQVTSCSKYSLTFSADAASAAEVGSVGTLCPESEGGELAVQNWMKKGHHSTYSQIGIYIYNSVAVLWVLSSLLAFLLHGFWVLFSFTFSSLDFIEFLLVMLQAAQLTACCPPELFVIMVTFAKGIWAQAAEGDRSLSTDVAVMPRTLPLPYKRKMYSTSNTFL